MDVKKIKVGMEIRNYKELCELLGVDIKTGGNAKIKQLKEFEKYFEWEKVGYSFKITKIYNKPRAFTEQEMIELLLLHLLVSDKKGEEYTFIATNKSMYEKLNMVNLNYKYCFNNPKQVSHYKNIPEQIVVDTTQSIDRALKIKLLNVLDNLSDRRILFYTDIYMICYNLNKDERHRVATDEEIKKCLEIEGDVLKELNCESYSEMRGRGLNNVYNQRVDEKLSRNNIKVFYKAIKIIFIEGRVPDLIEKYIRKCTLSNKNYEKYTTKVNKEIQSQTRENAIRRFNKAKSEVGNVANEIREMNDINEKINRECKPIGFNISPTKERLEELEIEKIDEYYIEKLRDKLKLLNLRSDENYLSYVDKLIGLVININTDKCIDEIRKYYNNKSIKANDK